MIEVPRLYGVYYHGSFENTKGWVLGGKSARPIRFTKDEAESFLRRFAPDDEKYEIKLLPEGIKTVLR